MSVYIEPPRSAIWWSSLPISPSGLILLTNDRFLDHAVHLDQTKFRLLTQQCHEPVADIAIGPITGAPRIDTAVQDQRVDHGRLGPVGRGADRHHAVDFDSPAVRAVFMFV